MPTSPTQMLTDSAKDVARAAELLASGRLVAFPTETVYGLGGNALNGTAVAGIFEAKGRPSFNPLIVHVASVEQAKSYVHWPPEADRLAQAFWPGALTLVLPLREDAGISPLVTAGLPSLAVRMPAHPLAQSLLAQAAVPVAAPSANPSGRISPTQAAHVASGLDGKIDAILDGGACDVGLESTILSLTAAPKLLREGGVPRDAIEAALGQPVQQHEPESTAEITAPGQLSSHYAPRARVRLNAVQFEPGELRLGFGKVDCDLNLSEAGDLREAAANLFGHLHKLDAMDADHIAVSEIPMVGLGAAINDRLKRAAAPR